MTWTADEQRAITRKVLGAWPTSASQMGREGIAAYVQALQDRGLDAERVATAIDTWPAGSDFPPSAPNLAAAALKDPSAPTFDEAVQIIAHVLKARTSVRKSWWEYGERDALNREAMLERAATVHPKVQRFIRDQSLDRLRRRDLDDPEYGQARRKQLRTAWEEFSETYDGREVASLVSARRGELGSFDPLAALDVKVAPRQLGSASGA